MNIEQLKDLSETDLADYLWKRLRLEEPLRPPLDRRFRMESPEDFIIMASLIEDKKNPIFLQKLIAAIHENLFKFNQLFLSNPRLDISSEEQIASLAFLATSIKATSLVQDFYNIVCNEFLKTDVFAEHTLFHLLRCIAHLQNNNKLVPFWEKLLDDEQPILRAIAYYGLLRADEEKAMNQLKNMLKDDEIDLPPLIWSFATELDGGPEKLAKATHKFNELLTEKVYEALEDAGADREMLDAFKKSTYSFTLLGKPSHDSEVIFEPLRWD